MVRVEVSTRELDGRFVRFGPAVREEHRLGERAGAQLVRELGGLVVEEDVRDVPKATRLGGDRLREDWMRVAQRIHREPSAQVQVAALLAVEEPRPFSANHDDVRLPVRRKEVLMTELKDLRRSGHDFVL
jgi:hypothetical protein